MLFNIKPETFEKDDMDTYNKYKNQTRMVLPMTAVSFWFTTYFKYRAYFGELSLPKVTSLVILSYVPWFIYFVYWKNKETNFIRSILHKYN